ncbi:transcriptional regulator [Synechococcus phage S-SRP02]|nr:transcriptional regulator [Synechococcus phage S-SRP02]
MKCPHCGSEQSRVTETRASADADRRIRLCKGCGRTYQTLERVCVFAGRAAGYVEMGPPIEPEEQAAVQLPPIKAEAETAQKSMARYVAALNTESLAGIDTEVAMLLVEWWNVSRRSKHKSNATWTQSAWEASVRRVAELPEHQQLALAQAGVEHGWQALKLEYLTSQLRSQPVPVATGRPMPKDPAMLAALESWPSTAA